MVIAIEIMVNINEEIIEINLQHKPLLSNNR